MSKSKIIADLAWEYETTYPKEYSADYYLAMLRRKMLDAKLQKEAACLVA